MKTKTIKSVGLIVLVALSILLFIQIAEAQSCVSQGDCATGQYCNSGTCADKKLGGSPCTTGIECITNGCDLINGCGCNSNNDCLSSVPVCQGGKCIPVGGCSSSADCTPLQYCPQGGDPTQRFCQPKKDIGEPCTYYYECGAGACTNGQCAFPSGGGGGGGGCASDSQCSSAQYCLSGSCVSKLADGQMCTRAGQCTGGQCTNNICASQSSQGQGGNMRCGCASDSDCESGESCGTDGICTITVTEPLTEGEEDPDGQLEDVVCPPGFRDNNDEDGDGVICDLCPSTQGTAEFNGCVPTPTGTIEPEFPVGTCRDLGGVSCQVGTEQCVDGNEIKLGEQNKGCCVPLDTNNDGVADAPSACQVDVFNPTLGTAISITRTQCLDPDGDGMGTKTITVNQQLPSEISMSDIAPECPEGSDVAGAGETSCQAPCSTIPANADQRIVPFYTMTTVLLSLAILTGFYIWRRKRKL